MSDLNTGIYLPPNDASSTAGYEFHPFSASVQGQNNENSTSKIFPPEYYQLLTQQISSLQQEVAALKKSAETSQTFFKQSVLLQRVCFYCTVANNFSRGCRNSSIHILFKRANDFICQVDSWNFRYWRHCGSYCNICHTFN